MHEIVRRDTLYETWKERASLSLQSTEARRRKKKKKKHGTFLSDFHSSTPHAHGAVVKIGWEGRASTQPAEEHRKSGAAYGTDTFVPSIPKIMGLEAPLVRTARAPPAYLYLGRVSGGGI